MKLSFVPKTVPGAENASVPFLMPRFCPSVLIGTPEVDVVVVFTALVFVLDIIVLDGHGGTVTISENSPLQGS